MRLSVLGLALEIARDALSRLGFSIKRDENVAAKELEVGFVGRCLLNLFERAECVFGPIEPHITIHEVDKRGGIVRVFLGECVKRLRGRLLARSLSEPRPDKKEPARITDAFGQRVQAIERPLQIVFAGERLGLFEDLEMFGIEAVIGCEAPPPRLVVASEMLDDVTAKNRARWLAARHREHVRNDGVPVLGRRDEKEDVFESPGSKRDAEALVLRSIDGVGADVAEAAGVAGEVRDLSREAVDQGVGVECRELSLKFLFGDLKPLRSARQERAMVEER